MQLSEYGFGDMSYSGGAPQDGQLSGAGAGQPGAEQQGPAWFRTYMDAQAQTVKQMAEQIAQLTAERRAAEIGRAFEAEGVNPAAASLYQGDPAKLGEWLSANKAFLAPAQAQPNQQQTGQPAGQQPAEAGQPVPPATQEALTRMQQAGTGAVVTQQGSDQELAAALNSASSPADLVQLMQAHGWQYGLDALG